MNNETAIGNRVIGAGNPCFIIAEAGVNHNGDIDIAHRLIDKAVDAGADAVKFQSFITEELITATAPKADYQVATTGEPGSQYRMLKALELNAEQQRELKEHCDAQGILYLCTPYEHGSIDMLDRIGVAAYKVASTDTTNVPFLRYMAAKGRPIILSTGMCTLAEVELAVDTLRDGDALNKTIILQCTAEYPSPVDEVNLRAMETMRLAFGCPVGFSDHTPGIGASPWAVAAGASVIEKHFTLDNAMQGPDHRASLEPASFAEMVNAVRNVEAALGDGVKRPMPSELPNKPMLQKSLVTRRALAAGQVIEVDDISVKRPGSGLSPEWFDRIIGQRSRTALEADRVLTLSDINFATD